jgi:hypothetical protein
LNKNNHAESDESYVNYKKTKCEFRRQKRKAEREWEREKYFELKMACELDIAQFYKTVRKQRKRTVINSNIQYNNKTVNSEHDACDIWAEYYGDLLSPFTKPEFDGEFEADTNNTINAITQTPLSEPDPILDNAITVSEVNSVVKNFKMKKAPGPDLITNEHIRYAGNALQRHLCHLFNLIIQTCYLPTSMRKGMIIPLYKGKNKDKCNPANYRGITLTSTIGKVFERLLLERLETFMSLKHPEFPNKLQCGFQ